MGNTARIPGEINELTHRIIGAAIAVHRELGPGLLESLYQQALELELGASGLGFEAQLLTYMKLASCQVGLLINFNVPRLKAGIKRIVHGYEGPTPGDPIFRD